MVVNAAFDWTAFLKLDEASGALIVDREGRFRIGELHAKALLK